MSKIRLNQNSQFEIQCFVNGEKTWRVAIHPNFDFERWEPDFDPEREILKEKYTGEFFIDSIK
jgi:hypothetical protein